MQTSSQVIILKLLIFQNFKWFMSFSRNNKSKAVTLHNAVLQSDIHIVAHSPICVYILSQSNLSICVYVIIIQIHSAN